ncbi:MAG: STAS domain-containing protein [Thermoleophilia bacterium]|jgi:anti-anti-sigma factor
MDVRTTTLGDVPLLEAQGDIDHNTCGSLELALGEAMEEGHDILFIDLQRVTYIDSGGLSVLLAAVRQLRNRGWLGAIAPNTNTRRLLEIVGLLVDPRFRLFETREAAEAFLRTHQATGSEEPC